MVDFWCFKELSYNHKNVSENIKSFASIISKIIVDNVTIVYTGLQVLL